MSLISKACLLLHVSRFSVAESVLKTFLCSLHRGCLFALGSPFHLGGFLENLVTVFCLCIFQDEAQRSGWVVEACLLGSVADDQMGPQSQHMELLQCGPLSPSRNPPLISRECGALLAMPIEGGGPRFWYGPLCLAFLHPSYPTWGHRESWPPQTDW